MIAEAATGPLDRHSHVVDIRPPTASSGRYHPRQITHWMHATALFPLREGYPSSLPAAADPAFADRRFAFHPNGQMVPLRVRKEGPADSLRTDLVRAEHFRARPRALLRPDGRLVGALLGPHRRSLPAAVAGPEAIARSRPRRPLPGARPHARRHPAPRLRAQAPERRGHAISGRRTLGRPAPDPRWPAGPRTDGHQRGGGARSAIAGGQHCGARAALRGAAPCPPHRRCGHCLLRRRNLLADQRGRRGRANVRRHRSREEGYLRRFSLRSRPAHPHPRRRRREQWSLALPRG